MELRGYIRRQIAKVIRWAVIDASGQNGADHQTQSLRYNGHVQGKSATLLPYGLDAWAPKGTQAVFLAWEDGQNRAHMPISRGDRVKAERVGEVVLHHPATGNKVHFREDGSIDIAATGDVNIDSATNVNVVSATTVNVTSAAITMNGPTTINGTLAVTGLATVGGTLGVTGAATFLNAVNVNSTNDSSGVTDLRGHRHQIGGESSGPFDSGEYTP